MSQGWIKLWRSLQQNPLWNRKPFSWGQAWVDLLLLANHKPGCIWPKGIPVHLDAGQVGYSKEALAARWGWSRSKVTRFLNALESVQQIVQQKNNLTTVVTITNWDRYQKPNSRRRSKRPADEHQTDTNKNDKNGKKERTITATPIARELAELLLDLIRQRKADFRQPNLDRWTRDIDRMIRLDGRDPERIEAVMRWCQADPFWQSNILSAAKLRKHFDTLEMKMQIARPVRESAAEMYARMEREGKI